MQIDASTNLLENYLKIASKNDETIDKDGNIKPIWANLFNNLQHLGLDNLNQRSLDIKNKLKENGVTYNISTQNSGENRAWKLDSIPFLYDANEWDTIKKGLVQRAVLLNEIYKDFYGSQKLIKDGVFPAHVLYGNDGFLPPCMDIKNPFKNQLSMYAVDFSRGPDQRLWILDNRTQSPSGSGYALENRGLLSSFLPELSKGIEPKKLAPYFNSFHTAITKNGKINSSELNIVYLTPGPFNETFFEHSYLASYFGYTLAQGSDLVVRSSSVFLKTVKGLEKVDVIIRRIDEDFSDPLELRKESQLGIPGLLQAMRAGNVIVINPPGTGILENHMLLPFMKSASRAILGEDLLMPNIATWWCGQPKELNYVLENLPKLIVKKGNRKIRHSSIFCRTLNEAELAKLREEIKQNPRDFVAQEECVLFTSPSLVDGQILPRLSATRAFLVSDGDSFKVMDGGLTRSSADPEKFVISNQLGGISKDTWIVDQHFLPQKEKLVFNSDKFSHRFNSLPSRAAENMFWAGRNTERVLTTVKFSRVILQFIQEEFSMDVKQQPHTLTILSKTLEALTYVNSEDFDFSKLETHSKYIQAVVSTRKKPGTVVSNLRNLLNCATTVNEKWNHDTKRYINAIENSMEEIGTIKTTHQTQRILERLQSRLFGFYGILGESFPRDDSYYFFEAGKYLERAINQVVLIKNIFLLKQSSEIEKELLETLLHNNNILVFYRQLYKSFMNLETTLDMLLLDETLPCSVSFLINKLNNNLQKLPKETFGVRLTPTLALVLETQTMVRLTKVEDLGVYNEDSHEMFNLHSFLDKIEELLSKVTENLTNQYFTHTLIQHSLVEYTDTDILNNEI
jgi:uncharacterized circularly permuted ATP-grasp superfamily protein/uncharacterized alpha-E superfamily protein